MGFDGRGHPIILQQVMVGKNKIVFRAEAFELPECPCWLIRLDGYRTRDGVCNRWRSHDTQEQTIDQGPKQPSCNRLGWGAWVSTTDGAGDTGVEVRSLLAGVPK